MRVLQIQSAEPLTPKTLEGSRRPPSVCLLFSGGALFCKGKHQEASFEYSVWRVQFDLPM